MCIDHWICPWPPPVQQLIIVKAIMADALNLRSRAMAKEAGRDGEHWR
jgi:hypothetical protein